jgi:hypothetical protein
MMQRLTVLQGIPARLIGIGFRPKHFEPQGYRKAVKAAERNSTSGGRNSSDLCGGWIGLLLNLRASNRLIAPTRCATNVNQCHPARRSACVMGSPSVARAYGNHPAKSSAVRPG